MINDTSRQRWERINAKGLDQQFLGEMRRGLSCSEFEALAVLDTVHSVYAPLFDAGHSLKPGQIQLSVVDSSVPPNVPLLEARQRLVTLTLHAGSQDTEHRRLNGVGYLRRLRLVRMAEEAFQQGGLLTLEDLSMVFNCGVRTFVRDLKFLRSVDVVPPLRSNVKDMGRATTHRREIVTLWLQGKEYSDIARASYHSVESVANYVDKFKRCVALFEQGFELSNTAFLVRISVALAQEFFDLRKQMQPVDHRRDELQASCKKNQPSYPKETM
jgi:hypothetical protein